MLKKLKSIFVGRPLKNEEAASQKVGILWGLPILSSDAISSVAYAGQEMLMVMIPAIGILAFQKLTFLSAIIVGLLAILVFSYRQTINSYPSGGGAFIVAKENLGDKAGVAAGAALSIDYVLTVAVSISSGVENLVSAIGFLSPYKVLISVVLILLLMLGNLRGVKDSSKMFGVLTYAFIFAIGSMIIVGITKLLMGYTPEQPIIQPVSSSPTGFLFVILMLRAFASGCTALTGIEAIANAVPNFKEPSVKYAKRVLTLLALIILFLFGGTSVIAYFFKANVYASDKALLVLIANQVFGGGFMYYFIAITTFVILVMAANTAYSGFPMLLSVISKEGYAPRQFSLRGDRLAFDNGIVGLSLISMLLIVIFKANVSALVSLYAIGIFFSFTLSQAGMLVKWLREKPKGWRRKALLNGFGMVVTSCVVIIITVSKFIHGAWAIVLTIPILSFLMLKVKRHYMSIRSQLKLKPEEYNVFHTPNRTYKNHIIIPIQSINRASVRAIKYAYSIASGKNISIFSVVISEEEAKELREKYEKLNIDIPLKIVYSPYRKIVEPLLDYIKSAEHEYKKGDMVTVLLSKFQVQKKWQVLLHNNTTYFIKKQLQKHKHIVVSIIPLQLKKNDDLIKEPKKDLPE